MPPSRRIELTDEQDERLREAEQNPHLRNKVRLRAQVLRLSGRGSNMAQIASYTGRSPTSIARDLDRWGERGLEGLADGTAPGNPQRISEEVRGRLTEERTWNATQLAEVLEEEFSRGHAGGRSSAPPRYGLLVDAHPLRAQQTAGPRGGARGQGRAARAQKGAAEGEIVLRHLDESGFYLCLPPRTPGRRRTKPNSIR